MGPSGGASGLSAADDPQAALLAQQLAAKQAAGAVNANQGLVNPGAPQAQSAQANLATGAAPVSIAGITPGAVGPSQVKPTTTYSTAPAPVPTPAPTGAQAFLAPANAAAAAAAARAAGGGGTAGGGGGNTSAAGIINGAGGNVGTTPTSGDSPLAQGGSVSQALGGIPVIGGVVSGVANMLGPASTAGVQQSAHDAQAIQNQFLTNYMGLQPGQAPVVNASNVGAVNTAGAQPINAAQMAATNANAASVNTAAAQPFTSGQMGLAANLQNTISNPNASSVAQIQQQQAFAQQMAQQQGLAAAMGRGGNAALAARTAMNNVGGMGGAEAGAAALQRAQETATAQGQLENVLQQGAGNALQVAGQDAANQQNTNLANQQAAMAAASQNAQQTQQASQFNAANKQQADLANMNATNTAALQSSQAQNAAALANAAAATTARGQDITQQANLGQLTNTANANQVNAQVGALNAANQQKQQVGNLVSGITGMLSDKRVKEDIQPLKTDDLDAFFQNTLPASWRYRGSPQVQTGPMAQDLEKSAVGRTMVRETPAGKAIDRDAAMTALLGMVSNLGQRVKAVESGRKAA